MCGYTSVLSHFRLLEKLGGRPKDLDEDMKQKVPLVWRPDRPIPDPFLGTMVRGIQPPPPLYDVDDIPFDDIVKGVSDISNQNWLVGASAVWSGLKARFW